MESRRFEINSLLILEAGKPWVEADADVSEAIDFCEYYALEMERLSGPQRVSQLPGERDEMRYIALGVGVVIPPWNFPLAITVGMTAASIVAGNPTILKPASVSPVIAYKFVEIMEEDPLDAPVGPRRLPAPRR